MANGYIEYASKEYVGQQLENKADATHNHDSSYDKKGAADAALASAKTYAEGVAVEIKNDLLNNAGSAYDTLKELGELIDDNKDAIDALEVVAANKADKTHTHAISDVTGLQSALDGKADSSHGTHVSYATTAPKMDGTASAGSASTVARTDHVHPTDTSRASVTALNTLESTLTGLINGKANTSHSHAISDVTNLQSTLDAKVPTSRTINGKALSSDVTMSASDVGAYTKTEIDDMDFITITDIDTICGASIQNAREVTF